MAFYKALEKIELKKYSEASDDNFGVVFYSKGSLKTTKLFDGEVKRKVSNFFEDESKASLMVSKEFSGLSRDILFVKDFDKKKPEHKKENWLLGVFTQLDKYMLNQPVFLLIPQSISKIRVLHSTLQSTQKNQLTDIQIQIPIPKRMPH